jgi:hypothetical protein
MATYIQGVTAYIPQFQPYQPDLNFESNLLQLKQSQYDTNWKALNNVYGQYFYADLTRDPNIKKKEDILKNIEFNLQRVAGLDLSLSQNTDQAMQVFKPFYEDNVLMKDMAWTKTKNSQRAYGMSLKNDPDRKKSKMYWNEGIKAIDYLTDEFKNSSDEESMSFGNVSYTPHRNVAEEARILAKESGISMETPSFSTDGRWMYQTKNGQQIMEPLSKLFEAELGSDPGIQDMYRTAAYVSRKDYVEENAAQLGSKEAAEMRYLQDNYKVLKEQVLQSYKNTQNVSNTYDSKIKDVETQIKNGTARPGSDKYLEDLKYNKEINDKVLDRFRNQNEEYFTGQRSSESSTGFENPYGDIKSLRMKVDNGVTWNKLSKVLNEAAQINAYRDYKVTQKENPYAVIAEKHANEMSQIRLRNAGTLAAVKARNEGEANNIDRKWRLESGTSMLEEKVKTDENGNPVLDRNGKPVIETALVDNDLALFARKGFGEGGNSTDENDVRKLQKHFTAQMSREFASPYFNTSRDILSKLNKAGQFSDEDLKRLQYGNRELKKGEKVKSLDQFMNDMSMYAMNNPQRLKQVKDRIDGFLNAHANLGIVSDNKSKYDQASSNFSQVVMAAENNAHYTKATAELAKQELLRIGVEPKYLNLAFDEAGRLRSRDAFEDLVDKKYGEKAPISGSGSTLLDPRTGKNITVTNKNYKDVTYNIGKHLYENGSQGSSGSKFYRNGEDAKKSISSALGTNEGMDAVLIDKFGNRTKIEDNRDRIKQLIKSDKSYIVKQTNAGGWFSDNSYVIQEVDPKGDKNNIYKQLGDAYVFNQFNGNVTRGNNKASQKYTEIQEQLDYAYSSSEIMKQPIPTIHGAYDPGTGLYVESSKIQVLPMNRQAPGTRAMLEFFNKMQDVDLDGMSSFVTFGGTDKTSIKSSLDKIEDQDYWKDFSQTAKGKFLIGQMREAMANPKMYKMKPFDIEYQSVAGGDLGKEAMILRPSLEFLKQFQSTNDKLDAKGQGNNTLTNEEFNQLSKHGLAVVAPSGTFEDNSLAKGSRMPLFAANAIYKDNIGEPISYEDSYGVGAIKVTHDKGNDQLLFTLMDKKYPENNASYNIPYSYTDPVTKRQISAQEKFNEAIMSLNLLSQGYNNAYQK